MSAPYTGGIGCRSAVYTANQAGTQIGLCGQAAGAASVPQVQGVLHTITVAADSTANTITVYDGTSTSGAVLAKIITATTVVPQTFTFDVQALVGLFIVISGMTSGAVTVAYA